MTKCHRHLSDGVPKNRLAEKGFPFPLLLRTDQEMKMSENQVYGCTYEAHYHTHRVRSNAIYLLLLFFLGSVILALPWTYAEVGVRSTGMIRNEAAPLEIYPPVSGQIETLHLRVGSPVEAGDTVATLHSEPIRSELLHIRRQIGRTGRELQDLQLLSRFDTLTVKSTRTLPLPDLKTERYRRSLEEFLEKLNLSAEEIHQTGKLHERNSRLHHLDLISQQELEESGSALDRANRRYRLLIREQISRWNLELSEARMQLEELEEREVQLSNRLDAHIIRSPVKGVVEKMRELRPGSYLGNDRPLAVIIPGSELLAELWVRPADIGKIRQGMPVRLQIDTYPHTEWGLATGEVREISEDIEWVDNLPVYRVRCSLNRTWLELPGGYRGSFRNGMTLQAHFILARRSLLQLLFDRAGEWFHPVWNQA